MMNDSGEFIENVNLKDSFSNLERISINEISDKNLSNKVINSNLVLHSNSKGECGVCYEDVNELRELSQNMNFKFRTLFNTSLNLMPEGETIQNNRGEFVHCFFFRKK